MRNISGLIPYQKLSKAAKAFGGPESYTSAVYEAGYNAALQKSAGVATGVVVGVAAGVAAGAATIGVVYLGYQGIKWLYNRALSYKEKQGYITWKDEK